MKRFVGRVLLACIGLFLLAEGLDVMVTQGLRKTDIRKYAVWNDIFAKPINADLVVIGSSRAWCGYNTYVLDTLLHCNSYNLGLDGHSFDAQLIRFH